VTERCDVAVVGSGPAGLGAATALAATGLHVVVLEREAELGGIPRHCGHPPFGMQEFRRVLIGPTYARRLVERARAAGVVLRAPATVTALQPGGGLELTTPAGPATLEAQAVLLATGVRETTRAERLIGGTKPAGVMNTGALQGLVYLARQVPFRRPVVLGTEFVAYSALFTCRHAGIRPVAMVEPGPRPVAWQLSRGLPWLLRIPQYFATEVEAVLGEERVTGVVLRRGGRRWTVAADGLLVTGGFRPEATLVRGAHLQLDRRTGGPAIDSFGRTSDPAFFAAGNLLRPVETAGWSWAEGVAVARSIGRALDGTLPAPEPALELELAGEAIKYALPQRLHPGDIDKGQMLQVRVARPVRGRLALRRGGQEVWSRRLKALPERRITVPLDGLAGRAVPGRLVLELDEEIDS